jgi:hypothetical protein
VIGQQLIELERPHLERLRDQLSEIVRKHDYRFRDEAYGAEADSWQRALALLSGEKGAR